ncbi:MAG: Hint domain-containing protein [Burkholderiales bacterium]|nr:Hint domain-containing protein [Burkholderiales bacterium]
MLHAPDHLRRWLEPGACFAKGTLVHTKEGLKPIEQIQVGDWVLSKPENGGEQAFKRVLRTIAHPSERIVDLYYIQPGQDRTYGKPVKQRRISVTRNHPFWTKEQGWTAVSELRRYSLSAAYPLAFTFEDKSGQPIEFAHLTNVYISDQPNVGWKPNHMGATDSPGALWDYESHKLIAASVMPLETVEETYRDLGDPEAIDPALFFTAPVYNLEVEDFHTYYVGEHGIWVHNQNCGGSEVL